MTKRDGEDDDLDLDLELDLDFEESVGEPRPMSDPAARRTPEGPPADGDADDDALALAGDLLADTGDELLASLSEADDGEPDELLVEFDEAPAGSDAEGDPSGGMPGADVAAFAGAAAAGASTDVTLTGSARSGHRTAEAVAEPAAADGADVEGQWVWQFAAPPPPPSFSAVFFAGRAHSELYWFFASGVLVLLGCLLPWGPSLAWVVERGESTLGYTSPPAGYELPGGAICLVLAAWLLGAASYGIYTGRQKILPVFMMLLPAWLSWSRTLGAWGELGEVDGLGFKDSLARLFEVAGTGVLLTMVGSTIVAAQLLAVILKVLKKQPPADGRARKSGDKAGGKERGKAKAADKPAKERGRKAKDKEKGKGKAGGTDDASAEASATTDAADAAGAAGTRKERGRRGRGR